MGIADERRLAELRYRQNRNKNLLRAIGYITSVIPAILIAFNFDSFRHHALSWLGGVPAEQVSQRPPVPVATPRPQGEQVAVNRPHPRPEQSRRDTDSRPDVTVPDVQAAEELPARPRQPVQMLDRPAPVKKPDHVFELDLSERVQYEALSELLSPAKLRIRLDSRASQELRGDNGLLSADSPVAIIFDGTYQPRINVTLEHRNDVPALKLEYNVDSAQGKTLPFTPRNLKSIRLRIVKRGERAVAIADALETEKTRLDAYLASSAGKLWTEKQAAEMRVTELPGLIAAAKSAVAGVSAELTAVDRLLALCSDLDGSKVEVFAEP